MAYRAPTYNIVQEKSWIFGLDVDIWESLSASEATQYKLKSKMKNLNDTFLFNTMRT